MVSHLVLSNGAKMPILGLDTWKVGAAQGRVPRLLSGAPRSLGRAGTWSDPQRFPRGTGGLRGATPASAGPLAGSGGPSVGMRPRKAAAPADTGWAEPLGRIWNLIPASQSLKGTQGQGCFWSPHGSGGWGGQRSPRDAAETQMGWGVERLRSSLFGALVAQPLCLPARLFVLNRFCLSLSGISISR